MAASLASAAAALLSIAASQILLGVAIVLLLFSGLKIRAPRIWLPLALFLAGTLLSIAFSGDPRAGLPQVRKIYVYTTLVVVYSTFFELRAARYLVYCWTAIGAFDGLWGIGQFVRKLHEAQLLDRNFYQYYMTGRITGMMSHWMTFSGEEMIVLMMAAAYLLFARTRRDRIWWLMAAGACIVTLGLVLSDTRSVWLACLGAGLYLAWNFRKWLVLALPAALAVGFLVAPGAVRERVTSIFHPKKDVDSNDFRYVCWKTGLVMIRMHPVLGVGPEEVKAHFMDYVPADIPRPLPTGWYGHLHNFYLHYAAERGIPTALMLFWMLAWMAWDYWRALRKLPAGNSDQRFILQGAMAVLIAILIEGIFELNVGDSEVLAMFLASAACGYRAMENDALPTAA